MMPQLLLHLWGDYIVQNDWMALNKSKRWWPAIAHCFTYTVPFILLTTSWQALAVIFGTHLLIDRFGLARYLVWFKNNIMCPMEDVHPISDTNFTGYRENRPVWLTCWLLIIADNTLHLTFNYLAITYL